MKIVYLHGFASSPASSKAQFFARRFRERGIEIDIPGLSEGDFEHLTVTGQLKVIDRAVAGAPVVLIGSSLGGYLAALYAARHPEVERTVLMAPAFGFGRYLPVTVGEQGMIDWRNSGRRAVFHYGEGRDRNLNYGLITDASAYEDFPDVRQPVLILHGTGDAVVPVSLSEEFARNRPNVRLVTLTSGHELTDVTERLWMETADFLDVPC